MSENEGLRKLFESADFANPAMYSNSFANKWNEYEKYRPVYPREALDEIFRYCDEGHKDRSLAVDYGTGAGRLIPVLLERFERVEASDIYESQIEQARELFAATPVASRVNFSVKSASEEHEWIRPESADLCISGEAIHWFDIDAHLREAARVLKPGGVLAFLHYPVSVKIISSPEADAVLSDFTQDLFRQMPTLPQMLYQIKCNEGCLHFSMQGRHFCDEKRILYRELPEGFVWEDMRQLFAARGVDIEYEKTSAPIEIRPVIMERKGLTVDDLEAYYQTIGSAGEMLAKAPRWPSDKATIAKVTGGTFDVVWSLHLGLARRR